MGVNVRGESSRVLRRRSVADRAFILQATAAACSASSRDSRSTGASSCRTSSDASTRRATRADPWAGGSACSLLGAGCVRPIVPSSRRSRSPSWWRRIWHGSSSRTRRSRTGPTTWTTSSFNVSGLISRRRLFDPLLTDLSDACNDAEAGRSIYEMFRCDPRFQSIPPQAIKFCVHGRKAWDVGQKGRRKWTVPVANPLEG